MAMQFANNGSSQSLGSVATVVPPVACSFSFWVKLTSIAAVVRFLGSSTSFEIRAGNGGTQPAGQLVNDMFINSDGAVAVTILTTGVWYHIVGTGELLAGNSVTDLYINGVLDAGPTTVAGGVTPGTATMVIGNRTGASSAQGVNGSMDDVRMYNRRLSAVEIETIYATQGHDGILEGLVSRVLMDEGGLGSSPAGAGSVKDVSETQNHFTPTGSPVYAESALSPRRLAS